MGFAESVLTVELASLFKQLQQLPPGASAAFRALEVTGLSGWYVGVDGSGQPTILAASSGSATAPTVSLALIDVWFGMLCSVEVGGQVTQKRLTVITCKASDAELQSIFFRVWGSVLSRVGPDPDQATLANSVQQLVSLFQRLTQPASKEFNGLVGELVLIHRAKDVEAVTAAWRHEDSDRFDFGAADLRVEVKTSSSRERRHHISLAQCAPPSGSRGYLASIFIEPLGGGTSLDELMSDIQKRLQSRPDLAWKVQDVVLGTLGSSFPSAAKRRIDLQLAASSLQFYDLAVVPAIRDPLPSGVSEVRFRSDLTGIPSLDNRSVAGQLNGFAPKRTKS